jgi:hypothetical protein
MTLPAKTYEPGWPEQLSDNDGYRYTRVRDGVPTGDYSGHDCLYVRETPGGFSREYLYTPQSGSTQGDVVMNAGAWMEPEQCAGFGVPPITLPAG